jgi:hypothetical protein
MNLDETTLAAFADGELAPEEAAHVEAEAARDPAVAARIDRLRALRVAVRGAFDDALAEAPPERALAAIRQGGGRDAAEVVNLAEARRRRTGSRLARVGPLAVRWGAVAASLVLAFAAGRFVVPPSAPPPTSIAAGSGGLMAHGALAAGLERQLASTQGSGAPVKIGLSFQASDGRYCRTFVLRQARPVAGLACRDPVGWRVKMALDAPPAPTATYHTAADETPAPVLEAVDQTIRGQPLDAAAEAKARDSGWRAKQ